MLGASRSRTAHHLRPAATQQCAAWHLSQAQDRTCLQGHSAWPSTAFSARGPRGVTGKTLGASVPPVGSCSISLKGPAGPAASPTRRQEERKVPIAMNTSVAAHVLGVPCGTPRVWVKPRAGWKEAGARLHAEPAWGPQTAAPPRARLVTPRAPTLCTKTGVQTLLGPGFGL